MTGMTVEPNITTGGSWVLLCYTFTSTVKPPAQVEITRFGPDQDTYEEQLDAETPCVQVFVPAGCTGVTIVDQSARYDDTSVAVTT